MSLLIGLLVFAIVCVVIFYCFRMLRPHLPEPWGTIIMIVAILIVLVLFIKLLLPALGVAVW